MKKEYSASLTVEASIIIPILLITLFTLFQFVKVLYIHEQVQHRITEAAEEMAIHACFLHKTGLVDLQQELYTKSNDNTKAFQKLAEKLEKNDTSLYSISSKVSPIKTELEVYEEVLNREQTVSTSFNESIKNLSMQIINLKNSISNLVISMQKSYTDTLTYIYSLLEEGDTYIASYGTQEGIIVINNLIGSTFVKKNIESHFTNNQCEKWGIKDGLHGFDLSESRFLIDNNDVLIVIQYTIILPFKIPFLKEIPMKQSVRTRAFIGNGNFKSSYIKKKDEKKNVKEKVYITINGERYHTDRNCRYIDIKMVQKTYGEIEGKKVICEVCERHRKRLTYGTVVYTTRKSSIFHTSKNCWTINRTVYSVEKEQAVRSGYLPCVNAKKEGEEND